MQIDATYRDYDVNVNMASQIDDMMITDEPESYAHAHGRVAELRQDLGGRRAPSAAGSTRRHPSNRDRSSSRASDISRDPYGPGSSRHRPMHPGITNDDGQSGSESEDDPEEFEEYRVRTVPQASGYMSD